MEGVADVSKSTWQRPLSRPDAEREVRTTYSTQDRHGIASRFLRLAYRINMDQLKLAELAGPPPLAPLSPEQLAAEEASAAQTSAELAAARSRGQNLVDEERQRELAREAEIDEQDRQRQEQLAETARLKQVEAAERAALAQEILRAAEADQETDVPIDQVSTNQPPADGQDAASAA